MQMEMNQRFELETFNREAKEALESGDEEQLRQFIAHYAPVITVEINRLIAENQLLEIQLNSTEG